MLPEIAVGEATELAETVSGHVGRSPRFGVVLGLLWAAPAAAQTDEIQVYDGVLAGRGVFNLTLHNNYVADGLTTPAFAASTR